MQKLIVPMLAAMAIGSVTTASAGVSMSSTTHVVGHAMGDVVGKGNVVEARFFTCAKGRHRGPLGYCRDNTARPLFIFRRPCGVGRHRNFFGRCVPNK